MKPQEKRFRLVDRLRYAFDNSMAAGAAPLIGWLILVSLALVLLAATLLTLAAIRPAGGPPLPFPEAAWQSLMRTLDPGTMGGDQGWGFRFVMLGVTLGGLVMVSVLIGIVTNGIQGRLDVLRKGRSFVVERDHTLILGWSSHVFLIIAELVLANANRKHPRIVVLADNDKVEMDDEIRAKVKHPGRTRVICRTGSPIDHTDLEIVNPHAARSIIILAPEGGDPDPQVIKSILALTNHPHRRPEPYHIVADIRDPRNLEVAQMVGRGEAQLVLADDVISRITVQTCRQSGMSVVYTELLDFEGSAIYFQEEPGLVRKTFGEALSAYEHAAVIGLRSAGGVVRLKPPMDLPIRPGDCIIAIAEDDDRVVLSGPERPEVDPAMIREPRPKEAEPERTLILGWNRRAPLILAQLDKYVAPGSEVTLVAAEPEAEAAVAMLRPSMGNQRVSFQQADTTDRRTLDVLDVPGYRHVVVLGYTDRLEPQQADAGTLITLLHLRRIVEESGREVSIVSEMLDVRNRALAEVTRADDFIVSDRLISLLLAQISENRDLSLVFTELFDPEGAEIYLKPAGEYVALGRAMTFHTVLEAARRRGEVAIGYRRHADAGSREKGYGVVVNPCKTASITFAEQDSLIVLAAS